MSWLKEYWIIWKYWKEKSNGDSLYWIASMNYRMKYYKKGYSFRSAWNSIRFYDYLLSEEVEFVACLKEQYAAEFEQHRKYITDLELLKYTFGEQK